MSTFTSIIFFTLVSLDMGSSSSTPRPLKFDISTQSGLTSLYNQPVTRVEHVTRRMDSSYEDSSARVNVPFVNHHGVVVTTADGDRSDYRERICNNYDLFYQNNLGGKLFYSTLHVHC